MLTAFAHNLRRLIAVMAWLAGIGVMLLVIPTVIDVISRAVLGPSVPGIVEYSEIGLVAVVFLAMASAMHRGVHISTPILTDRLPEHVAKALRTISAVLVWLVLSVVAVGVLDEAFRSFAIREYRFGLIEAPVWPAKALIAFGMIAAWMEATLQLIEKNSSFSKIQVNSQIEGNHHAR